MATDPGKDKGTVDPETAQAEQADAAGIWGGGCLPGPEIPNPFPPKPTAPAMTIAFKFALGDFVQVNHNRIQGAIMAAAVILNETSNIYLVDVGREEGKWYPESMLRPVPVYYLKGEQTSPTPTAEEKADEAD